MLFYGKLLLGRAKFSLWRRIYVADAERSAFRGCSWQNSSVCLQSFSPFWIWCEKGWISSSCLLHLFTTETPFSAHPTHPRPPDLTMDLLFSIFQNPIYLLLSWKPCLSRAVSLCVKDSLQLEPWCRNNRNSAVIWQSGWMNLRNLRNSSAFLSGNSDRANRSIISKFTGIFQPIFHSLHLIPAPFFKLYPKHTSEQSEEGNLIVLLLLFYCLWIYMQWLLPLYAMEHFSEMKRKICSHLNLSQTTAAAQRRREVESESVGDADFEI